jgi:hypothetical protein
MAAFDRRVEAMSRQRAEALVGTGLVEVSARDHLRLAPAEDAGWSP